MAEKVEVHNSIEKAIIQSLKDADNRKLTRGAIIRKVMSNFGSKESTIAKRIDKMGSESCRYLIKTTRGIYELNPEIEFNFIGEPLPHKEQSTMISLKSREEHTKDLKPTIENWIENFPKVPESENCNDFRSEVKKCESFRLFEDLLIHLPKSGYDICHNWERFKNDIKELERDEKAALKLIEKSISDIFKGLRLTFVTHYNNLRDSGCAYAYLIYSNLIYVRLGISKLNRKYPIFSDEEEYYKYRYELDEFEAWSSMVKDRLNEMIIFKENDSAIWGEDNTIFDRYPYPERWECIRVPTKDIEALEKGKDEAKLLFSKLPSEIDRSIDEIVEHMIRLEDERNAIMGELRDSLYCKSFQGDCKYLGSPARK
jgi:hypothetical protein